MKLGTLIAGKYFLDRVIGHGGMGLVVQATHLQLQQPVAIKFLLPAAAQDADTVQRFLREARAAVRLRGEHVARVLDVGALATGTPYMVLEYLDGTDLERFPRAQLTVGGLVDLMLQACEALAEAHALGIVHRDIKPANFFVTTDPGGAPFLKLLDFGISKTDGATGKLTTSQVVLGTPAYMSPEQVRASRKAEPRSDLWSLGIVLYELLEGVLPFEGDGLSGTILQIVNDPPPKLTARLPAGLDGVIYRCLEKDPERRFQSTAELAAALAPYAGSPAQAAITLERTRGLEHVPRRVATSADDADGSAARRMRPTTPARRVRRSLAVAAGILVAAGIVQLAVFRGDTTAAKLQDPAVDLFAPAPDLAIAPLPASPAVAPAAPEPAPAPPSAPPAAVETGAAFDDAAPVDDGAALATGAARPQDAPVRRPARSRAKTQRVPTRSEAHRNPPSSAPDSPRFDRGD